MKATLKVFKTSLKQQDMKDLLMKNGFIGLILVFIVLSMFLRIRLALWVMLGIPISFLGALLFMPGLDVSINMMSLFAFIMALGIVVDDAIIVGENIFEHRQRGKPFMQAAVEGALEVGRPVTFAVLDNDTGLGDGGLVVTISDSLLALSYGGSVAVSAASTTMVAMVLPSETRSPTLTASDSILPATGDGTSMVALSLSSVMSGSSGWTVSPGATSTSIISTSWKSPISGTSTT